MWIKNSLGDLGPIQMGFKENLYWIYKIPLLDSQNLFIRAMN
jgi:hypothetical protein